MRFQTRRLRLYFPGNVAHRLAHRLTLARTLPAALLPDHFQERLQVQFATRINRQPGQHGSIRRRRQVDALFEQLPEMVHLPGQGLKLVALPPGEEQSAKNAGEGGKQLEGDGVEKHPQGQLGVGPRIGGQIIPDLEQPGDQRRQGDQQPDPGQRAGNGPVGAVVQMRLDQRLKVEKIPRIAPPEHPLPVGGEAQALAKLAPGASQQAVFAKPGVDSGKLVGERPAIRPGGEQSDRLRQRGMHRTQVPDTQGEPVQQRTNENQLAKQQGDPGLVEKMENTLKHLASTCSRRPRHRLADRPPGRPQRAEGRDFRKSWISEKSWIQATTVPNPSSLIGTTGRKG